MEYLARKAVEDWLKIICEDTESDINYFMSRLDEALVADVTAPENWIKVKDRLPDNNLEVLVYVRSLCGENDCITLGSYNNSYCWFLKTSTNTHGYPILEYEVTHWAYLPEPPAD